MILRKLLLLVIALALLSAPVLQAAHGLSHLNAASDSQVSHDPGDNKLDKNCGLCLILTTFTTLFSAAFALLLYVAIHPRLPDARRWNIPHGLSPPYSTRAPPLA